MRMKVALVGLMMAMLLGCATAKFLDTNVIISNDISHKIKLMDVRCVRDETGYCVAQANVHNISSGEITIEWKVQWLDANGVEIESLVNTWQKQAIPAQDIKGLRNVAPSKDAVTMRFYVRRLKRK